MIVRFDLTKNITHVIPVCDYDRTSIVHGKYTAPLTTDEELLVDDEPDPEQEAYKRQLIERLTQFYKEKNPSKVEIASKLVNKYFPYRIYILSAELSSKYGESPLGLDTDEVYRQELIHTLIEFYYKRLLSSKVKIASLLVDKHLPDRIDTLSEKLFNKYGESPFKCLVTSSTTAET